MTDENEEIDYTPSATEIANIHTAIDEGKDPTNQVRFLLHLIEGSVDQSLNEHDRRKAFSSQIEQLRPRLSETARETLFRLIEERKQPPITASVNGSTIKIEDVDEILRVARRDGMAEIYNETHFPTADNNTLNSIRTKVSKTDDPNVVTLRSDIDLAGKWNAEGFKQRFTSWLPRKKEDKYIERDGILIEPTAYNNSFYARDNNGVAFKVIVLPDREPAIIEITNSHPESEDAPIKPIGLDDIDLGEQLKSLGKVTALVADLCATLRTNYKADAPPEEIAKAKDRIWNYQAKREYKFTAHNIDHIANAIDEVELAPNSQKVTFDDIGGYDEVKKELEEAALLLANRRVSQKWDVDPPQGILMYGPPGTGKTTLARALANEIGADFESVGSTEIYEMWVGESGKNLKAIFDRLKEAQKPTIVFFDEIESFIRKGKHPGDVTGDEIAGIFKRELNNLSENNPNVIVMAATNDLEAIDPSIIRAGRFDLKIEVPLPNEKARTDILAIQIMRANKPGSQKVFAEDFIPIELAQETEGLSGADLVEVLKRLKRQKAIAEINKEPAGPITQQEFLNELKSYREELRGNGSSKH